MTGTFPNLASIDINPLFRQALDVMENTLLNVFITGRAGTGKSTLLNYFREHTGKRELVSEVIGSFTQYPVRLAFAVTIHKSQGKTFEKVIIDLGRGTFAHGQMYVALSRCTHLEGIVLKQPVQKNHILMDWQVVNFLTRIQYARSRKHLPREQKLQAIEAAIRDRQTLEIVYLKAKDEKSRRSIQPLFVGGMEYNGHPFTGLTAFCLTRREKRVFNIDKILEISGSSG